MFEHKRKVMRKLSKLPAVAHLAAVLRLAASAIGLLFVPAQ